jgi:hypothetical protein
MSHTLEASWALRPSLYTSSKTAFISMGAAAEEEEEEEEDEEEEDEDDEEEEDEEDEEEEDEEDEEEAERELRPIILDEKSLSPRSRLFDRRSDRYLRSVTAK